MRNSPLDICHADRCQFSSNTHVLGAECDPSHRAGNQVHTDDQISVPLEAALATGKLDVGKIMANAKPANCIPTIPRLRNATFHLSTNVSNPHPDRKDEREVVIGHYETNLEDGTCVWRLTGHGDFLKFPHYFDGGLKPVDESAVPPELAKQEFPLDTTVLTREFNGLVQTGFLRVPSANLPRVCIQIIWISALTVCVAWRVLLIQGNNSLECYSAPGPADPQLYCAQSKVNGYWLGWRWYKFVDQPALQRERLSEAEKTFLQQRVETLHGAPKHRHSATVIRPLKIEETHGLETEIVCCLRRDGESCESVAKAGAGASRVGIGACGSGCICEGA